MKILLSIFLLMAFLPKTYAQKDSLLLYPEGTPGLKASAANTPEDIKKTDLTRIRSVTKPSMYVYSPKNKTSDAAVIICPGGGYSILAIDHEGHDIAKWFNERGIMAFVLKYRLPQDELFENKEIRPLQDAQQAIRILRKNASKYGISTEKIGIMGFSAGGHLASTASTHFQLQVGEITDANVSVRPDFSILMYPVISFNDKIGHLGSRDNLIGKNPTIEKAEFYSNDLRVTKETPPTFLISTTDDFVQTENTINYFLACKKNKVPVEMHVYEKGGHGYGLTKRKRGPVETWDGRLEDWMKNWGWMK